MPERPGFNPDEGVSPSEDGDSKSKGHEISRRTFLSRILKGAIAVGAGSVLVSRFDGCPNDEKNGTDNNVFDNSPKETEGGADVVQERKVEKIDPELEKFLKTDVLREELARNVEGNKDLKAELARIISSETAVYYASQYSASPKGLERKFSKVLDDQEYREQINALIRKYCAEFRVPYSVAFGVGANESGFKMDAESGKGAQGIFQLMPGTASSSNLFLPNADPIEQNIYGGIKYLRVLYDKYGQWSMAMMAYSTGPGSFAKKLSSKNIEYKKEDGDKKVNAVTLYSKKHFGFGGIHPFQYPFYILSVADVAMKIMGGGAGRGDVGGLMSDEDFRTTCQEYPEVKGRIRKRMNASRYQEIFKRLKAE